MAVTRVLEPEGTTVRRVGDEVAGAVRSGQWRYADLLAEIDVDRHVLDHALLELARDGQIALYPLGDVLRVEPNGKGER